MMFFMDQQAWNVDSVGSLKDKVIIVTGGNTGLGRYMKKPLLVRPLFWMFSKIASTPYVGALPEIRACLDDSAKNGQYYGPSRERKIKHQPVVVDSNKASHSLEDAKKLWTLSEQLTHVKFKV